MADDSQCQICHHALTHPPIRLPNGRDASIYDCPVCGLYELSGTADTLLDAYLDDRPEQRAVVAHFVRTRTSRDHAPVFYWDKTLKELINSGELPTVLEQSENVLRILGETQLDPGLRVQLRGDLLWALAGCRSDEGFYYCIEGLEEAGLLKSDLALHRPPNVSLTFKGWERYGELYRGKSSGRTAFMAMGYGDPNVNRFVEDHFRTAVRQTGYRLLRLDDAPEAGLIDTRMIVEIKSAAFLIADLTGNNSGAYWEAGFAEGLGKPVIYTCSSEHFGKERTHFDTNHHMTVTWNPEAPEEACELLKATIRNTMPDAILED